MSENEAVVEKMLDKERWYGDAEEYWKKVEPSVGGMLQGFEDISGVDSKGSKEFLKILKEENILTAKCRRAADCGAGIGRVTKHLLLKEFQLVDIVELCEEFTRNIYNYMNDESLSKRIENIFTEGLQTFEPKAGHYDIIWMQWVVGHLVDDDFISFLKRCKKGLTPGGCIVIKDNIAGAQSVYDAQDSSVTRTHKEFFSLFTAAGLETRKVIAQKGFPSCLFKVNMYALT